MRNMFSFFREQKIDARISPVDIRQEHMQAPFHENISPTYVHKKFILEFKKKTEAKKY